MTIRQRLAVVTPKNWAWIHFKFSIGILLPSAVIIARITTANPSDAVSPGLLYAWMGTCIAGAVLCIIGNIGRAQPESRHIIRGIAAETSGLVLMFSGPFMLFVLYLSLYFAHGEARYLTGAALCYALSAVMVARWMEVNPIRRRGRQP